MSGFRDTFTKEEPKESLLGYDDTAFYYFACCLLLCVVIPWTWRVLKNLIFRGKVKVDQDFPKRSKKGSMYRYCKTSDMVAKVEAGKRNAKMFTSGSCVTLLLKMLLLGTLWVGLFLMALQIGQEKEIKTFDPFTILEVTPHADASEIKKAYRRLSLIYHPDKNPDDPLASSRFIQITKAHAALTDEVAKRNYEKYGNPDGPTTTKVGIGLPLFLLRKENHFIILSVFFFALLFVVPMTFICYYQRTKNYAANGVMIDTMHFLTYYINETTRVKNCPELFAASAESRRMRIRSTDNAQMKPLMEHVTEHKKRQFSFPIIIRNQFLVWAHMQRLHHHMSPELRSDCDELLKYSVKITQAMIEIACMREWFFTAQAMIEFRRSLIQALDVKSSQLLQIPHFTEEVLKHCLRGKNAVGTLAEFLSKDAEQRKGLSKMDKNELADVEAFASHVSSIELKASIEVEDEEQIVAGDVATITAAIFRKNLRENEAIGPVHAPFFPEPKLEEWWLFLVEAAPATRIISYERIWDTERIVEQKLRFHVSRPGKHNLVLHALCDSYAGIDQKVELNFDALQEDEVKREIVLHPEDEDLDLQPTLFQQFMGELNVDEESEEEEEENHEGQAKQKPHDRNLGAESKAPGEDGEGGEAREAAGDGADDADASSSASSDPDSD